MRVLLACSPLLLAACSSTPEPKAIVYSKFDPPVKTVMVETVEYRQDERQGAGLREGGYEHVLQRRTARPEKKRAESSED